MNLNHLREAVRIAMGPIGGRSFEQCVADHDFATQLVNLQIDEYEATEAPIMSTGSCPLTLTPSPSRPGEWQVTRFCADGQPWGHENYRTYRQGAHEVIWNAITHHEEISIIEQRKATA